jgi:predicted amidohydrolase YtcJ
MAAPALIIRNVEIEGRPGLDARIEGGRIAEVGARLAGPGRELDGRGGALIPGLVDHHIHLLGFAAEADSIALDAVADKPALVATLRAALTGRAAGAWVRAVGYHDRTAGLLSRDDLDQIAPDHALRVQHQTGSLWILNSLALDRVLTGDIPPFVERDAAGRPTGRIWRGDAWLRARIGAEPPPLAPAGRRLAALGVTAVTDASAANDAQSAGLLADAARSGALPQRLMLMSAGPLSPPADAAFAVGPVKVLLDDHDLPDLDVFIDIIRRARRWGRAVAVHCVTAAEFAVTLAAFEAAGAEIGDRVEHGGLIPAAAIASLADLGLAVVTQPAFVFERGDRYLADVPADEHEDLYRCASLLAAGVPVAASSDAPYATADPWLAMEAAIRRRTRLGETLGAAERVRPERALALFLGAPDRPGGPPRRVIAGAAADLCLLKAPLKDVLDQPTADQLRVTLIGGRVVYEADGAPSRPVGP